MFGDLSLIVILFAIFGALFFLCILALLLWALFCFAVEYVIEDYLDNENNVEKIKIRIGCCKKE